MNVSYTVYDFFYTLGVSYELHICNVSRGKFMKFAFILHVNSLGT
jgi:hypothetical protein